MVSTMIAFMSADERAKRRRADRFHRYIANPVMRRLPTQVVLETVGRNSGLPRRTPVGGRLLGQQFWLVANHGETAQYVRNIAAHNQVRLRLNGRWRTGTAHLMPDDDPLARLAQLPRFNSAMVRALGTNLLTIRIDVE
jgi:deazaflavin-dependent oxidoreductase (nitroreductase family)